MLSELTTSERRVSLGGAVLILAFFIVASFGYGLLALWVSVLVVPVVFGVVLVAAVVRGRR
ncbi:MAG: hypothetical protein AAGA65_30745 [Actinomycetota bacterium]